MDTVINFKTDTRIKTKAQKIAAELGLSLSGVLNVYLHDFVRTKRIYASLKPSGELLNAIAESEEDYKKGITSPGFNDAREATKWLKSKKRKYANKI